MDGRLDSQTLERKKQIFRNTLRFQESAAGVVVQRVTGSYLYRILRPVLDARKAAYDAAPTAAAGDRAAAAVDPSRHVPDPTDPLVRAIYGMDATFAGCASKDVDMLSSAEGIAMEWKEHGAPGHACLMLAWRTVFDGPSKRLRPPELVGAMTLHRLVPSTNFSTDHDARPREGSMGDRDNDVLNGRAQHGNVPRRNYFARQTMYIDGVCAKGGGGVGKILLLHAVRWAIMRKCTGIAALSYSSKANSTPESYRLFETLEFEKIIPKASYKIARMHGTWFYKSLDSIGFSGILADSIAICTRGGLTEKTKDTLIWRCPQ